MWFKPVNSAIKLDVDVFPVPGVPVIKIFGLVLVVEGTVVVVAMVIRRTPPGSWPTIYFSRYLWLKKDVGREREVGEEGSNKTVSERASERTRRSPTKSITICEKRP